MVRWAICVAGILGASAVGLGAYHAHGMEKSLAGRGWDQELIAKRMDQCETGLRYQLVHAVALIALAALMMAGFDGKLVRVAAGLMIVGTLVFSGTLYAIVATNVPKWGAVTPIGGLLLITSWVLVAVGALKR